MTQTYIPPVVERVGRFQHLTQGQLFQKYLDIFWGTTPYRWK